MAELTRERLGALRVQAKELLAADRREVLVCAGTGCIAGGSLKIYDYLKSECEKRGLKTRVALRHEGGDDAIHFKKSGCHGFCEMGPLLQIEPEGFLYTHVRLEDCDEIIERTILGGEAVERLLYELNGVRYAKHNEIPFYAKQQRVVLENCGTTDAEDIDEYLAHDGYAAFEHIQKVFLHTLSGLGYQVPVPLPLPQNTASGHPDDLSGIRSEVPWH